MKDKIVSALRNKSHYIFIVAVGLVLCIPLLQPGLTNGNDAEFHMFRNRSTISAISDGQILPQVDPNMLSGFGYSFNMFYGPLSTYVTSLLKFIVQNWNIATNLFMIMIILLSGIIFYKVSFGISKNKIIASLAAVIYMAMPYHIMDVYIRQDQGELLSFLFAPILFYGLYKLIHNKPHSIPCLVVGASGIILSHNLSIVIFAIFSLAYLALNFKKILNKAAIKKILISGATIVGLTSFYIFPLLELKSYNIYSIFLSEFSTRMGTDAGFMNYAKLPIWKLFINQTPVGLSNLPFSLGLLTFISLILLIFSYKKISSKRDKDLVRQLLIISVIAIILSTNIINWNYMPAPLCVLQFPWRLLLIADLGLSIVSAYSLYYFFHDLVNTQKTKIIFVSVVGFLAIISVVDIIWFAAFNPKININIDYSGDHYYYWSDQYNTAQLYKENNYKNSKAVPANLLLTYINSRGKLPIVLSGKADISNYESKGTRSTFEVATSSDINIELPYTYYPGYKSSLITSHGTISLKVAYSKNGLVLIEIPKNHIGKVSTYYGVSKFTFIGLIVTTVTALGLFVYRIIKRPSTSKKRA